jgi:8-amino-7-oxononanoate synthase
MEQNLVLGLVMQIMSNKAWFGSTGSRLVTGNTSYHEDLESLIASYHDAESCTLFGSGYLANIGILSAISTARDTIIYADDIHASMKDSLRLCKATVFPFRSLDLSHLDKRLQSHPGSYIVVQSISSTTGNIIDKEKLIQIARRYNAHIIVDEAHAVGIYGDRGQGIFRSDEVYARIITFSKALGVYGACVLGPKKVKDFIINFANSFIYSTALPSYNLAAIEVAYKLLPMQEENRLRLRKYSSLFTLSSSVSPIQSISIGSSEKALKARSLAEKLGYSITAFTPPTVKESQALLRVCMHSYNTRQEVQGLNHILQELL